MIRKGTLNDAAAIADIFNHYVRTSTVIFSNDQLSADEMREKLEPVMKGGFPFFVDVDGDGTVTGYAYAHLYHPNPVYGRTWEITIYLRHGYTGRQIGSRLLERIINESRDLGAHTLISCITGGNMPCEKMHLNHGFTVAGTLLEVGYKFDQYLDDRLYQLML